MSEPHNIAELYELLNQHQQDLADHKQQVEERLNRGEAQFATIIQSLAANTSAIETLTANTRGVVQAYADVQAAARVGTALQSFVIWCAKWGGAIALLGYAVHVILEHFKRNPPGN